MATADTQEVHEDLEFVDQSVWIPHGCETVPAAQLLNRHIVAVGKRFMAADPCIPDKLLSSGFIEESHHFIALKLLHLLKLATSKQGYATMQIFAPAKGYDNSEFCPMTMFIHATRNLKVSQMHWIRILCGLETSIFETLARNALDIRDTLDAAERNLYLYEKEQRDLENKQQE